MELPRRTTRLFPHETPTDVVGPLGRSLLIGRLLEDGDGEDLRWLTAELSSGELAAWFAERGGRKLSRRSRAFWAAVLETPCPAVAPGAADLWPL